MLLSHCQLTASRSEKFPRVGAVWISEGVSQWADTSSLELRNNELEMIYGWQWKEMIDARKRGWPQAEATWYTALCFRTTAGRSKDLCMELNLSSETDSGSLSLHSQLCVCNEGSATLRCDLQLRQGCKKQPVVGHVLLCQSFNFSQEASHSGEIYFYLIC